MGNLIGMGQCARRRGVRRRQIIEHRVTGLAILNSRQNHLTTGIGTRILDLKRRRLFMRPVQSSVSVTRLQSWCEQLCHPRLVDAPLPQYGVSLEPNFNQQPYCRTDGWLACRLRRRRNPCRHAPSAPNRHARYNDDMLRRLVEQHRLQRRRDGERQRRELHSSVLDKRRQSICQQWSCR